MTTAQRFAREWLWWICCWMVALAGSFIELAGQFRSDPEEGLLAITIASVVFSVPLYLISGAVRLTVWALNKVGSPAP